MEEDQPRMKTDKHGWTSGRCFLIPSFCLLVASCSLPQAQHDPTRFYVLSAMSASPAAPVANAPVVHLRQVELASYLRARPIVIRRSENEVEFREFARWGESLELGIARVLREELLACGAAGEVLTTALRSQV